MVFVSYYLGSWLSLSASHLLEFSLFKSAQFSKIQNPVKGIVTIVLAILILQTHFHGSKFEVNVAAR